MWLLAVSYALLGAVSVDVDVAPAFDPARLRALVLDRLANDPLIGGECSVRVTSDGGALILRVGDQSETVERSEPGVMELELLRKATTAARAACPVPAPSAAPPPPPPPSHARAALERAVSDGDAPPPPPPPPLVTLTHGFDLGALRYGIAGGVLVRDAVDGAVTIDGSYSLAQVGGVDVAVDGLIGGVFGTGSDVVSTEGMACLGAGVALWDGTVRIGALVGARVDDWWGSSADVNSGGRADVVAVVPATFAVDLGGVDIGLVAALVAARTERSLTLYGDVIWHRAPIGIFVGIRVGGGGAGTSARPGA